MKTLKKVWELGTPYVTEEGGKSLLAYKLSGHNAGYAHNYCLLPVSDLVAPHVPAWIG